MRDKSVERPTDKAIGSIDLEGEPLPRRPNITFLNKMERPIDSATINASTIRFLVFLSKERHREETDSFSSRSASIIELLCPVIFATNLQKRVSWK